jgi:hypothetical protein
LFDSISHVRDRCRSGSITAPASRPNASS